MREDVWRVQIKHTVKWHLDRELQLQTEYEEDCGVTFGKVR